jgi:hypothetical protein
MVIDNVFGLNSVTGESRPVSPSFLTRVMATVSRQFSRVWCGMHGHLILLHFEPNKLSLQCGLCGYESEGWEVGRPLVARRASDTRSHTHAHTHSHQVRPERRSTLRAVPSTGAARLAS